MQGSHVPRDGSRTAGTVVAVAVVLATLVLGVVLAGALRGGPALPPDPVGAEAPLFELTTLDGGSLGLEELRGGPVVLTFWASWCTTCKADVPTLQRVAEEWGPRGVRVLGVVVDDTRAAASAAAEEVGASYPSVFDGASEVRDAYGVRGTPETFLLDADGRVAARWVGPLPAHELELRLAGVGA